MRVAVVSCWKYRDAWFPAFQLLRKYWPNRPEAVLLTDEMLSYQKLGEAEDTFWFPDYENQPSTWCGVINGYTSKYSDEPILLLQEDFFLNAPVNTELVERGLKILERDNVGAVRLYPCPGATDESDDPYFAPVARGTMYRTSCQATIWKPAYLAQIASRFDTPSEFELHGSPWASENLPQDVWAFKREVQPWPISYFCSAISRGKWEPAALEFCRQQGIEVDTSMRPVA